MDYRQKMHKDNVDKSDYEYFVLGADIGGTNTNMGIAGVRNNKIEMILSTHFQTKKISSVVPAIDTTLALAQDMYNIDIRDSVFGVAGTISDDGKRCKLTNVDIDVDIDEILRRTPLRRARLLNDFELIGFGINMMDTACSKDIVRLKEGASSKQGDHRPAKAAIGAGTGLGKSILVYDSRRDAYVPIPSEGGHVDFPAKDEFELKLVDYVRRHKGVEVCYEELLSGRGIENIYDFLRSRKGFQSTSMTDEIDRSAQRSMLISKYREKDPICKETFRLFAKYYARCGKNFVLDTLAMGGLYIAGGIAAKNKGIFRLPDFLEEFLHCPPTQYKEVIERTPIYVILDYDISIIGACFAAMKGFQTKK